MWVYSLTHSTFYTFIKQGKIKQDLINNGTVHPIYSPSGYPRWICFFIGTDLEKFSITSLAHQWIPCSEWVPSEWGSKQLIKTSQIYMTPVHLFFFYFNRFHLKYESSIDNIALSSEKVLLLVWIRKEICRDQAWFTSDNSPKWFKNKYVQWILKWFFTTVRIIMDYGLFFWPQVTV